MENPSLEELLALKRIELIDLADELGVSIKKYFKKQFLDEIIVNLVDNEILEEAMEYISKKKFLKQSKLSKWNRSYRKKSREKHKKQKCKKNGKKLAIDSEIREKEIKLQKEIKERVRTRIFIEKEKIHFYVTIHIHFVPPFNENEVDRYFLLFEKVAKDLDWLLNKYTISLQSVLKGKASEVYLALKQGRTSDYQTVKETILTLSQTSPGFYVSAVQVF